MSGSKPRLSPEERARREKLSETRRKAAIARWERLQRKYPNAMRELGKAGAAAANRTKYGGNQVMRDGKLWRVFRLSV